MSTELRDAFIQDVVDAVRGCEEMAGQQLSEGTEPTVVVSNALNVLAHSLLVILDGGTKLSDQGQVVWLTDRDGAVVADGLHEWLPDGREAL